MLLLRQMTVLLLGISCGTVWGQGGQARPDPAGPAPPRIESPDLHQAPAGESSKSGRKVEALREATFLLVVLVLIFAVSLLAFRRWSKHYRARLLREPHGPTEADDVWAMHRLPEEEHGDQDNGREARGDDDEAGTDDNFADDR